MKARLIKNPDKGLILLCEDGTIAKPDDRMLYQILVSTEKKGVTFGKGEHGRWISEYPDMTLFPGKDVAAITDNGAVILYDFLPFQSLIASDHEAKSLLNTDEFAKKHNVSVQMVKAYCRQGRIRGASKIACTWLIPEDAEWPIEPNRSLAGLHRGVPRKKSDKQS